MRRRTLGQLVQGAEKEAGWPAGDKEKKSQGVALSMGLSASGGKTNRRGTGQLRTIAKGFISHWTYSFSVRHAQFCKI